MTDDKAEAKATEILRIVEKYGLNYERTGSWDGFATFLPVVKGQVERGESVKMLLPGFPFKSPNNKTKVLGVLPDLGEASPVPLMLCTSTAPKFTSHLTASCTTVRARLHPHP
jgi:pyoverdine/dityrosine biosynthesis protein Dit1